MFLPTDTKVTEISGWCIQGMSRQNVEHYMRFRDQMKVGADGQKRLRLVDTTKSPT
jgi:hypothetical protein